MPNVENIDKDVSVEVSKDNEFYYLLDGLNFEWQAFYEEFAGDDYFKGPELSAEEEGGLPQGVEAEAGVYTLKVFSPDNQGKYVLAVGEREAFTFTDTVETLLLLPSLKQDFFEKPAYTAYFNIMGLLLLVPLALLAIIIVVIYWYWKRAK